MPDRLIVAQLDRVGYQCDECGRFHGNGEPLFAAHWLRGGQQRTHWTETHAWTVQEDGHVTRVPALVALQALAAISEVCD